MRLILCTLLVTLLSACSTTEFRQLQSNDRLATLQGFAWNTPAVTEGENNQVKFDKTFRQAVGNQLQNKGYQASAQAPALLLEYSISIIQKETKGLEAVAEGVLWTRDSYNDGISFDGWNHTQGAYELHEKGIVLLIIRDAADNSILWQGGVARILEQDLSFHDIESHAKRAAARLVREVPAHQ